MDGALAALSRNGVRKTSMSDVTAAAGISRGTLYRHFANKQDLLDAIAAYIRTEMQRELELGVAARPALSDRVQVVVEVVVRFATTHPLAIQVVTAEPEFGTAFIRDVFPEFVSTAEALMAPALTHPAVEADPVMSPANIAELAYRIAATTYFIPSAQADNMPRAIAALLSRYTNVEKETPWEGD